MEVGDQLECHPLAKVKFSVTAGLVWATRIDGWLGLNSYVNVVYGGGKGNMERWAYTGSRKGDLLSELDGLNTPSSEPSVVALG